VRQRTEFRGDTRSVLRFESGLVYRRIDVNVYQKSTGSLTTTRQLRDFRVGNRFSADYHQKSSGKESKLCRRSGVHRCPTPSNNILPSRG